MNDMQLNIMLKINNFDHFRIEQHQPIHVCHLLFLIQKQISNHMSEAFSYVDFQTIKDELELKNITESIVITLNDISMGDEKAIKQPVHDLLSKIHAQITNPSHSPKSKLMSLMLLREFTEKHHLAHLAKRKEDKHSKLFSILATHPILKELKTIAEQVDPYKQVHEKGKSYFPTSSVIGNDFIRLILELLRWWSLQFQVTTKKQATAFKRYYDELIEKKVIFPNDYKFLLFGNKKNEDTMYDTGRSKPGAQARTSTLTPPPPAQSANTSRSTVKTEIYRMYNRLLNFVQTLDEDISAVEPQIRTVHNQIKNDQKKYQRMQEDVFDINAKEGDEDILNKYVALNIFMQKEMQFHQQYISNSNDYQSYILAIKLQAEKCFPDLTGNNNPPIPAPTKKDEKDPKIGNKRFSMMGREPERSMKQLVDPQATNLVANYFSQLEARSKSPITGFKKINQSFSREKSSTVKRSISPINRSKNITKSMASLKESKISPIFINPPNQNPPPKSYEGRLIRQNESFGSFLHVISKSQGLRRFKTANFKGKSSLFQNQHMQIGYKSEAIYQQVNGFKVMIKIELFFGNLNDERIQNIKLQFKGDSNILLYANPRAIQSSLLRGEQNKIDLMIVPLKVPFPLLNMTLRYDIKGEPFDHKIVIPNSVLKLVYYMSIPKWMSADILQTSETKLCHYLPPDTFTKWIPELGELSSYTAFAIPRSVKDYELYCAVIMMEKYEALLKINIRPNLEVIIQLGLEDRNQEANQYCTYFLETLQQLLKEVV